MQSWCNKLRSISRLWPTHKPSFSLFSSPASSHSTLHTSPNLLHKTILSTVISSNPKPLSNVPSASHLSPSICLLPTSLIQVRHITAKQRKRKLNSRKPMTPVTSKVKKIKMKSYSSYKGRFKTLNDGTIRRWKEGKRHNAHLKSKKSKRRLRCPGTVPLAYAKVMKKLNFCG